MAAAAAAANSISSGSLEDYPAADSSAGGISCSSGHRDASEHDAASPLGSNCTEQALRHVLQEMVIPELRGIRTELNRLHERTSEHFDQLQQELVRAPTANAKHTWHLVTHRFRHARALPNCVHRGRMLTTPPSACTEAIYVVGRPTTARRAVEFSQLRQLLLRQADRPLQLPGRDGGRSERQPASTPDGERPAACQHVHQPTIVPIMLCA